MRLPEQNGKIDLPAAETMVALAMEHGCNYFDTAYVYEGSEEFIGKILSRYPRNSYYLTSKMPIHRLKSKEDMERIFQEQLRRTRAGYFDFYFMHWLNRKHWQMAQEFQVWEFLKKKKAEGRIRRIGFSFHDEPELLEIIAKAHPWELIQIQLNYLDWEVCRAQEMYEVLTRMGIPISVMEPLKGGALVKLNDSARKIFTDAKPDASIASWGLRYAASLPNVQVVLSGMSSMEQVKDNLCTFTNFTPLTDVERKTLANALTEYRRTGAVPCTGCRYCKPCPHGVDIPRNLALYNQIKSTGSTGHAGMVYQAMAAQERASNCTGCGACRPRCPQEIDIPARLKETAAEFKKA
ncbi:MAG: aldo/keto reductase [Lentisphaeria bacterium]|nr:aldo/keto reductase [Lentisphaeria bacterium]